MHGLVKLSSLIVVASFMLQMGLALPRERLKESVRHAGPLLRGALLMLVVAPIAAVLVVRGFGVPRPVSTAILATSATGVVPLAPRLAAKVRGNVAYAVVLTALLGVVAMFTAPATTAYLVRYTGALRLDVAPLILQLVALQIAPFAVGLVLARRRGAARLGHALGIVNTAALVVVVAFAVVPRLREVTVVGARGLAAIAVLSIVLAATGYLVASPERSYRRTLFAIANAPNVALSMVMVTTVGSEAPPDLPTAISAVFILRMLCGAALRTVVARRHAPPTDAKRGTSAETSRGTTSTA